MVIVQDAAFESLASVAVCLITSVPQEAGPLRVRVRASAKNGLQSDSYVRVDKVAAMPRDKIAGRSGDLSSAELDQVSEGLALLLGLARA